MATSNGVLISRQRQQRDIGKLRFRETFNIPMSEVHLGHLFGARGRNINKIHEDNDCKVIIKSGASSICVNNNEVTVTVKSKTIDGLTGAKADLIRMATQITKSQRKQEKRASHRKDTFTIPMAEEYSGLLIGEKGRHIKQISEDHDCKIHVNHDQPERSVGRGQRRETTVTVKANTEVDMAAVRKSLITRARHIAKRQRNQQKTSSLQAPRGQRTRDSDATLDTDLSQKEVAKINYARRGGNQQRWRNKRRSWHTNSRKPKPIKRCCQCLTPHSATLDAETCSYHPGYIKNGLVRGARMLHWSCCQQPAAATTIQAQIYAHRNSRCSEGSHSWTPRRRKPVARLNIWPELNKHIYRRVTSKPCARRRRARRRRRGRDPRPVIDDEFADTTLVSLYCKHTRRHQRLFTTRVK